MRSGGFAAECLLYVQHSHVLDGRIVDDLNGTAGQGFDFIDSSLDGGFVGPCWHYPRGMAVFPDGALNGRCYAAFTGIV